VSGFHLLFVDAVAGAHGGSWPEADMAMPDSDVCFQRKWEAEGDSIVDRVARDNPEKILEVMARVQPKELAVTVQQQIDPWLKLQQLDADALVALGGPIDAIMRPRPMALTRRRCSPGSRKP
jgi:hypothetical protein